MSQESTTPPNESLRKAAVLIRSLPPEAAATLIGRLSPDEAASLRASIAALGDVGSEERVGVAEEIRGASSEGEPLEAESGGVELRIESLAETEAEPELEPVSPEDPFQLLREADPSAIASYLSGEQSRAAALVLSCLAPEIASAVLENYPEPRQAELLGQMSRLGDADPDTVRILATDLADWVREKNEEHRRRADRLSAVRGVLSAAGGERRRRLAAQIARHDPATAERLGIRVKQTRSEQRASATGVTASSTAVAGAPGSPPTPAPSSALAFDDLERLAGEDLVAALGQIGGRAAVLALAGASEALLRRVEGALTKKAAKQMRGRIARLGQTTLAEVEASQRALAAAAERIVVGRRVRRVAAMN